ncbi:hypothetical protein [Micromonospora sp. AB353]|uniref:hypothetical protein n=1 Tax=Micromonospora TaxID=1873 RepID=UPI003C1A796D
MTTELTVLSDVVCRGVPVAAPGCAGCWPSWPAGSGPAAAPARSSTRSGRTIRPGIR